MVYAQHKSVQKNEMHKLIWDFEIKMDPLISARWRDLMIIKTKKNLQNSGFYCPCRPQSKIERDRKDG